MMRILDRQRYWNFFKAYLICFVSLVGLYVVIDAFSNIDEFLKRADGMQLLPVMGRFYLIRMSLFFDRLCGVIGMMAAIFTVTWMQRNNELLAMLAAGISTQRVIRPVLVCAVLANVLAVVNQEVILPPLGEELQKNHADDGKIAVPVYSRRDLRDVLIHGQGGADREANTIFKFSATLPIALIGSLGGVEAKEARYFSSAAPRAPRKGGWLLRGARLTPSDMQVDPTILERLGPEDQEGFPPPRHGPAELAGDTYFLHTDITFADVTRNRQWFRFSGTPDLVRALFDPSNDADRLEMEVFLHGRVIRPLLNLALMVLSLPLVLGGEGRNTFINLGLSLGTSAIFYAALFISQYLAGNALFSPELAAWGPLIAFGTWGAARWDTIRT